MSLDEVSGLVNRIKNVPISEVDARIDKLVILVKYTKHSKKFKKYMKELKTLTRFKTVYQIMQSK